MGGDADPLLFMTKLSSESRLTAVPLRSEDVKLVETVAR